MNISQWKNGDRTFFSLEVDDRLLLPNMNYSGLKVTYSYPKVTHSYPKVTYSDPKVSYSYPKVTYCDPKVTHSAWPLVK